MFSRRAMVGMGLFFAVAVACGGGTVSVLHSAGKPSGDGPARLTVKNSSGVTIERLYVARTAAVDAAAAAGVKPGSDEDLALWGEDQLGNAGIQAGQTFHGLVFQEARYDFLAVAHDHREQLVKGIELRSGGKYKLEIGDAWAMGR